jgi:hypothetical protein
MTEARIDFLYDDETVGSRLRDVWRFLRADATSDDGVAGQDDPPTGGLLNVEHGDLAVLIDSFDDASGDARWTVPDVPHLELGVETGWFDTDPEAQIDRLFALVRWVYEATDDTPAVVYGLDPNYVQLILDGMIEIPVTTAGLDDARIGYVGWFVVFPPAMVDRYGRDTLLSAPAARIEEYDDGAVLVAAYENPAAWRDTEPLNDYLGLDDRWQ